MDLSHKKQMLGILCEALTDSETVDKMLAIGLGHSYEPKKESKSIPLVMPSEKSRMVAVNVNGRHFPQLKKAVEFYYPNIKGKDFKSVYTRISKLRREGLDDCEIFPKEPVIDLKRPKIVDKHGNVLRL